MILAYADSIDLLQSSIAVGLIKTGIVLGGYHVHLRHVQYKIHLVTLRILLKGEELTNLSHHVNNRARPRATGQACTYMESHIRIARRCVQTTNSRTEYGIEIARIGLVAEVIGEQRTA